MSLFIIGFISGAVVATVIWSWVIRAVDRDRFTIGGDPNER